MPVDHRAADVPVALFDYDGAAAYICTTPRHVRELWQRRQITGVKVGRSVRFAQADLDEFIDRHRVKAVR